MSTALLLFLGFFLLLSVGTGIVVAAVYSAPEGVEDADGFREVGTAPRRDEEPTGALLA